MAVFACQQCGHIQPVDNKHLGKSASCPKCKAQGMVDLDSAIPSSEPSNQSTGRATIRSTERKKTNRPFANEASSLRMEWIVVDDPRLPVGFREVNGVMPSVDGRRMVDAGGGVYFHYTGEFAFQITLCAVQAFEVRLLLFDIWGSHVRTLSASEIRDLQIKATHRTEYSWELWSVNEGNEHHASIAYVARVRTADGRVLNADTAFILREAQRFSEKFTEADLEPKAPKKDA